MLCGYEDNAGPASGVLEILGNPINTADTAVELGLLPIGTEARAYNSAWDPML